MGEFCSRSCLSLMPGIAWSIHTTSCPLFRQALNCSIQGSVRKRPLNEAINWGKYKERPDVGRLMFKVRTDGSARSMLLTSSNDGYYSTFPAQVFKTDSRQLFILSKIISQATSIEQKLGTLKIRRSANRNGNAGRDPIRLASLLLRCVKKRGQDWRQSNLESCLLQKFLPRRQG